MSPHRRSRESGSAYIVALLVLVVLSLIGLALALITQSEQQLGSNELQAQRAFYGAESGIQLAIARVLTVDSSVENATVPAVTEMAFTVPEMRSYVKPDGTVVPVTPVDGGTHYAARVNVSPFVPIRDSYCDMCPAAEGDVQLLNVNHAVVATAQRVTWNGDSNPYDSPSDPTPTVLARKQVFLMVGLQPWWPPRWEAIADSAEVQKVTQEWNGQQ
jgi:hypothetical protein